jgi:hypothetical protein
MPKYKVTVCEEVEYALEVDADNQGAAINIGREKFLKMRSVERDKHCVAVHTRYVDAAQLKEGKPNG